MIPAVKSRRGMTLAELLVSMALVAVMIVVVVSFVMLLTGHTRANGEHLAFQQEFSAVKACVEGWMEKHGGKKVIIVDPEGVPQPIGVSLDVEGENDTLKFQNGALTSDGFKLRAETIENITFHLEGTAGEYLLFCTVTRVDSDEPYTFCVNPRVGEMAGA